MLNEIRKNTKQTFHEIKRQIHLVNHNITTQQHAKGAKETLTARKRVKKEREEEAQ